MTNDTTIQLVDLDSPEQSVSLSTPSPELAQLTSLVDRQMAYTEAQPLDMLNAANAFQAIRDLMRSDKSNGGVVHTALGDALKVQNYLHLAQIGQGMVMDAIKATKLVQAIIKEGELTAAEAAAMTSKTLSIAGEGIGSVLGIANVGLDIFELVNAKSGSQRSLFATQLTFDSASTTTGVIGLGLALSGGAEIGGAFLTGAGVILAGIGIGTTALVKEFDDILQNMYGVGKYFEGLYDGLVTPYTKVLADKTKPASAANPYVLMPEAGSVIESLDLVTGEVMLDSPVMYSVHDQHGDTPNNVLDKDKALSFRDAWNSCLGESTPPVTTKSRDGSQWTLGRQAASGLTKELLETDILVLPQSPKSYVYYKWDYNLPAHFKHPPGFNKLRQIQDHAKYPTDYPATSLRGERFPFRFDTYWFTWMEINELVFQYEETRVTVNLDGRARKLVVPDLSTRHGAHDKLTYAITGRGAQYDVVLRPSVKLELAAAANPKTTWLLMTERLESDTVSFTGGGIDVGGVTVDVKDPQTVECYVLDRTGELSLVDFEKKKLRRAKEDLRKGNEKWKSPQALGHYLDKLAATDRLTDKYVEVDNYTIPDTDPEKSTAAYYDVAKKRYLYTADVVDRLTTDAVLATPVAGDDAYFVNEEHAAAWCTNAASGKVTAKYELFLSDREGKIDSAAVRSGWLALSQRIPVRGKTWSLNYGARAGECRLSTAVVDGRVLQQFVDGVHVPSIEALLVESAPNRRKGTALSTALAGKAVQAGYFPYVAIQSVDDEKRVWVRTKDGLVIDPRLELADTTEIPSDLTLLGAEPVGSGGDRFFFYSATTQQVWRQDGPGTGTAETTVTAIPVGAAAQVLEANNTLLMTTSDGFVLAVKPDGRKSLVAVNAHWLDRHPKWWEDLEAACRGHVLAYPAVCVFGLKSSDGKTLPAWYDVRQRRVAIQAQGVTDPSGDLAFLGVADQRQGAYFFDAKLQELYWQPLPTWAQLARACPKGRTGIDTSQFLAAERILDDDRIRGASVTNDGLTAVTTDGRILRVVRGSAAALIGIETGLAKSAPEKLGPAKGKLVKQPKPTDCAAVGAIKRALANEALTHGEVVEIHSVKEKGKPTQVGLYDVVRDVLMQFPHDGTSARRYLGLSASSEAAYFAKADEDGVDVLTDQGMESSIAAARASRGPTGLTVVASKDGSTLPCPDVSCCNVTLSSSWKNSTFKIEETAWEAGRHVVIDAPGESASLELGFWQAPALSAARVGDDLVLAGSSNRSIVIRGATGSDLEIALPGSAKVDVGHAAKVLATTAAAGLTLQALSNAPRHAPAVRVYDPGKKGPGSGGSNGVYWLSDERVGGKPLYLLPNCGTLVYRIYGKVTSGRDEWIQDEWNPQTDEATVLCRGAGDAPWSAVWDRPVRLEPLHPLAVDMSISDATGYSGRYWLDAKNCNQMPTFVRENAFIRFWEHANKSYSTGYVWELSYGDADPKSHDKSQEGATDTLASGVGETPWTAAWSDGSSEDPVGGSCAADPLFAQGIEVSFPAAPEYDGVYWATRQLVNGRPVFKRTVGPASYVFRWSDGRATHHWVLQTIEPDVKAWSARTYGDGPTPWEASWDGDDVATTIERIA